MYVGLIPAWSLWFDFKPLQRLQVRFEVTYELSWKWLCFFLVSHLELNRAFFEWLSRGSRLHVGSYVGPWAYFLHRDYHFQSSHSIKFACELWSKWSHLAYIGLNSQQRKQGEGILNFHGWWVVLFLASILLVKRALFGWLACGLPCWHLWLFLAWYLWLGSLLIYLIWGL